MFMLLLLFLTPDRNVSLEHAHVHALLQLSPGWQSRALGELLVCAKGSARLLRIALPELGDDGTGDAPSPVTRAILLTTRSRSVFWRFYTTTTSRKNHKRKLLSPKTITIAFRFEMCAFFPSCHPDSREKTIVMVL
jgi:hypothetical protein